MKFFVAIFFLLVTVLSGGRVGANDAAFGGEGSHLIPLQETKIKMRSEEIVMEQRPGKTTWHVQARYQFQNPTRQPVTLQMGFPERQCEPDGVLMCNGDGRFQNLQTWVRGKKIKEKRGTVAARHAWAPKFTEIYLYEVTFASQETVEIRHAYAYDGSVTVAGDFAEYVTETGGLWNGPIGQARFIIRTGQRPAQIVFPSTFALESYIEWPQGGGKTAGGPGPAGGGTTEIIFAMKNWRPTDDLTLFLAKDLDLDYTDTQGFTANLQNLSVEELQALRNKIFARHGYPFQEEKWRKLFYRPPEVRDDFIYEADWQKKTKWVHVGFRENPHYNDSLLTKQEKKYIELLLAEEKKRR